MKTSSAAAAAAVFIASIYAAGRALGNIAVSRRAVKPRSEKYYRKKIRSEEYLRLLKEGGVWLGERTAERVSIRGCDGLLLSARYIEREGAKRTVVCMHGYRSSPERDFGGVLRFLYESGCNLLLPDQRAHGQSEGEYICYGVKERYDCRDWAAYAAERSGGALPVYLYGVSMGCTCALLSCGLEPPPPVRGVIADSGFTSPGEIFKYLIKRRRHLPAFPLMQIAERACRRKAGFGFNELSTLDAMKKTTVPALFLHGGADNFVPPEMTVKNYRACASEKYIEIFKGAGHALSSVAAPERYCKVITDFFGSIEVCS